MKNITESLDILHKTIELLLDIDQDSLSPDEANTITLTIANLEEVRRLLYHEKNNQNQYYN